MAFVASSANVSAQKEAVEIVLDYMDLELALRMERLTSTSETSNEAKIEKWDCSNRMYIMITKRSIP
ncbi:hypothetical protein HKD37_06G017119 [Glycine soja]